MTTVTEFFVMHAAPMRIGKVQLKVLDLDAIASFHTALLVPSGADLARWLAHAVATRVPLQGASDHIVSEAIYLSDPEGTASRSMLTVRSPAGSEPAAKSGCLPIRSTHRRS